MQMQMQILNSEAVGGAIGGRSFISSAKISLNINYKYKKKNKGKYKKSKAVVAIEVGSFISSEEISLNIGRLKQYKVQLI